MCSRAICRKVKALLPECMINAGVRCCVAIDPVLKRCHNKFIRVSIWCKEKYSKYEKEVVVTVKIIGIIMFSLDLGTDSFTGVHYINSGKYIEGIVIITFTILPMLLLSLRLIFHSSLGGRNYKNIRCLPSLTATVCSPILPLGWLVLDVVASIGGNNSDNENNDNNAISESTKLTAEKAAKLIKTIVAVGESYPQTIIQLFIVFASLVAGDKIEVWIWVSIAVSLTSLSFSVSTGYLNAEAASSSKAGFFLFGMLALGSRQVVCCVYSMHKPVLWLVPFCAQVVSSIIIKSISSKCKGTWAGLLIYILTEAYNSFTLSGLLTSTIYLGFALGGLFLLEVDPRVQVLLIIALVLTSISWTFNVLFTVLPHCEDFSNDWMKKHDAMTTEPDVEGAIPDTEFAQLGAVGISTEVKNIPSDTEETVTVIETHPGSKKHLLFGKVSLNESKENIKYVMENQGYVNEILPVNEDNNLDAKENNANPIKPSSDREETYL